MSNTTISFPGLGLEFDPGRYILIGSFEIYYYAIAIATGLALAVIYACRRSKQFGIKEDDILDGVLWVVPFALICTRAYYVIFKWDYYSAHPAEIFAIRDGGLAIYGGVLGAVIGVSVFCRIKKIKLPALLDLVSLGFLIGQMIGRWGNFFNREAFGGETENFLRMGLYNAAAGAVTYHHPTFLYESLWNFAGFLLLHNLSKKRQYDGQIALGYVAWYGLGRTFIEGLRTDSLYWGAFRVSQLLAAVSCVAAVAALLYLSFRRHDPAKLLVNQVAAAEAAAAVEATAEAEEPAEE